MLTICIASGKGGTAKTSLTAALATFATTESKKVAMIDLNLDQASLTTWWVARGSPNNPYMPDLTNLADDLQALEATGWKFCLIDTPPDDMKVIETAILDSNVVVIPVRPSDFDVAASKAIVDMCRRRRKPFAFVLSVVDTRPAFKGINDAALADLRKLGPVLKTVFPYRKGFISSISEGKTGHEVETSLKAAIAALWAEVKAISGKETKRG